MKRSESIRLLSDALSRFQGDVKNPKNTEKNDFYNTKYAPLNEFLNEVRPVLARYGLSVMQFPECDGQNVTVTTLLMHNSGEWIESEPLTLKADKVTPQGAGSALTYARRYAVSAILGLSSDDDDDGNNASTAGSRGDSKQGNSGQANKNNPPAQPPKNKAAEAPVGEEKCSACGKPTNLGIYTKKKFGKVLCKECMEKAQADSNNDFPEESFKGSALE
jgi:hypothetical protein